MANYHYDEAGNLAAFFLISVLALLLVPLTLTSLVRLAASPSLSLPAVLVLTCPVELPEERVHGCQCRPCLDRKSRVLAANKSSLFSPKFTKRCVCSVRRRGPGSCPV